MNALVSQIFSGPSWLLLAVVVTAQLISFLCLVRPRWAAWGKQAGVGVPGGTANARALFALFAAVWLAFTGWLRCFARSHPAASYLLTAVLWAALFAGSLSGCMAPDAGRNALSDFDREYGGFYNVTSGTGGIRVRWRPAATPGNGHPSVGMEIDFKQPVEAMRGL